MEIYIVEMLRWGSRDNHSYVHGVYSTEDLARASAKEEEESRGGKYEAEIICYTVDKNRAERMIRSTNRPMFDPVPRERRPLVGDVVLDPHCDVGTVMEINEDDVKVAYPISEKWHSVENLEKYTPPEADDIDIDDAVLTLAKLD